MPPFLLMRHELGQKLEKTLYRTSWRHFAVKDLADLLCRSTGQPVSRKKRLAPQTERSLTHSQSETRCLILSRASSRRFYGGLWRFLVHPEHRGPVSPPF